MSATAVWGAPEGALFQCYGRRSACGVFHTSEDAARRCSTRVDHEKSRRVQFSIDGGETWSGLGKPGAKPAVEGEGRSHGVAGRVSRRTKDRLDALAARKDRTASSLVAEFVEAGLDAFEPEQLPEFTLKPPAA